MSSQEDLAPTPVGDIAPSPQEPSVGPAPGDYAVSEAPYAGALLINADDWGRDHETTARIFECVLRGTVSSVSAMVFMQDSERAAAVALDSGIDAGLHLNFTMPFSATNCPRKLVERQHELVRYLRKRRLSQVIFNVSLVRSFEYVVAAQLEEYYRVYGAAPTRLDGHHHMHLCANVLLGRLLPAGTVVRRNFSSELGEMALCNRIYRKAVDRMLARRHGLADFFFSLLPLYPLGRMQNIISLARQFVVEVETHPVNPEEYRFLTGAEILHCVGDIPIARRYAVDKCNHPKTNHF